MAKAGRKPKLTKEFVKQFCELVGDGLNNKDACAYLGVTESAYYEWLNEAREEIDNGIEDSLKIELLESSKKAVANFKLSHLKNIRRASEQDWKASAWTLERKFPNEFGQRVQADVGVSKINVKSDVPTHEENNEED